MLLGILGDALLRTTPWGINFLLWVSALIAAMTAVGRWSSASLLEHNRWLALGVPASPPFLRGAIRLRCSSLTRSLAWPRFH
ncbi:MAG: hypothetical protein WKF30_10535 [Pyrinomonadaceae bacterium]